MITLQQFLIRDWFFYVTILFLGILIHEFGHFLALKLLKIEFKPFMKTNLKETEDVLDIKSTFGFEFNSNSDFKTLLVSLSGVLFGLYFMVISINIYNYIIFPALIETNFIISRFINMILLFAIYVLGSMHDLNLIIEKSKLIIEKEKKLAELPAS